MESPKNEGERLPIEGTSDLSARLGADYELIHEALDVFTKHTDTYHPAMQALERMHNLAQLARK